jgi:hypothetical protein
MNGVCEKYTIPMLGVQWLQHVDSQYSLYNTFGHHIIPIT